MGRGDRQDVLSGFKQHEHADLLVGLGRSDDAAVYRITDEIAIVSTVGFFPPIVDDPYLYGAIAAANSMSDVYAMGGQVLFALNVAGFPREMPKNVIAAVFKGGAGKGLEAGGGAWGAGIPLRLGDIPVLPGALALAEKGTFSGGMKRNRAHLEHTLGARGRLSLGPSVGAAYAGLLFESETSGGLLFGVASEDPRMVQDGFKRRGEACWGVGGVTAEIGIAAR